MKKSGITLVEMIVAMLLSAVLITALISLFVSIPQFNSVVQNNIDAEREAYMVVRHMSDILRFADPVTAGAISLSAQTANPQTLTALIKQGHLSFITTDTTVYYSRNTDTNTLSFSLDNNNWTILSQYVTFWDLTNAWNSSDATHKLTIAFNVTKNSVTIPVRTTIKVIGDL